MQKLLLVLAATVLVGCVRTEPVVYSTAARLPNVDAPNVRVTIGADRGVENVNIKRGGASSLNYAFGTPERRTVSVTVSDERYLEFRDLCVAVLREPPSAVNGANVVNVDLLLLDDQLVKYGLPSSRATFSHRPGENQAADALLKRVSRLLDEHRVEKTSK